MTNHTDPTTDDLTAADDAAQEAEYLEWVLDDLEWQREHDGDRRWSDDGVFSIWADHYGEAFDE